MNRQENRTHRRRGLAAVCGFLALGLAAAAPSLAAPGGGGGGDSIGSLPLTSAGSGAGPARGVLTTLAKPSLSLTAPKSVLESVLLQYHPQPSASLVKSDLGNGMMRYTFLGRSSLVLDRKVLEANGVDARLEIGPSFAGGMATIAVGGKLAVATLLPLGSLDLHLAQLSQSGVADKDVLLHAVNASKTQHAVLAIHGAGGVLQIDQRD
ncbi:MAG TPA: hypothetical protein VMS76_05595 [Planctomycetota bacterium]|nr:hypothetical protein [Planctomycetota bacterium]